MDIRKLAMLAIAFVVAFLAVGWPYWQVPYAQVALPDTLMGYGLGVVVVAAAAVRSRGGGFLATVAVLASTAPAAVMARVVRDTAVDPTSHNLWPFEVVTAAVVGIAAALLGAIIGTVLTKTLRDNRSS